MPTRSKKTPAAQSRRGTTRKASAPRASVIMQARIDGEFAKVLVERDAAVLGLDGPSELVREGLRLVHQRAEEQEMADSYDAFYDGKPAPLPLGVAPAGK
ncbi:MAG: hypothetical protein ACJ735_04640 [Actinomycetes bacterium]